MKFGSTDSHCVRNITQSTEVWRQYGLQICGLIINKYNFPHRGKFGMI